MLEALIGLAADAGHLLRDDERHLTREDWDLAAAFGIAVKGLSANRSVLCRACLDWSEHRSHLAGRLGRLLLASFVELGWARVDESTRMGTFTPSGFQRFYLMFDLRVVA